MSSDILGFTCLLFDRVEHFFIALPVCFGIRQDFQSFSRILRWLLSQTISLASTKAKVTLAKMRFARKGIDNTGVLGSWDHTDMMLCIRAVAMVFLKGTPTNPCRMDVVDHMQLHQFHLRLQSLKFLVKCLKMFPIGMLEDKEQEQQIRHKCKWVHYPNWSISRCEPPIHLLAPILRDKAHLAPLQEVCSEQPCKWSLPGYGKVFKS